MAIQKTKTEKPHTDRPTGTTVRRKLQGLETGELPRVDFLRLARGSISLLKIDSGKYMAIGQTIQGPEPPSETFSS